MHEAFDLSREPQSLRERYGMHGWGQRALMARRLVEAGCSFVTVAMENPYISGVKYPKLGFYNWDSHAVNCDLWKDAVHRFPIYDKAVTALIEDLHERSLTKKVLLVVTGEFGRSPKISRSDTGRKGLRFGREHWPQAMSVLVCGGGMEHGQVVGSTNAKMGEHPHDRPLTPNDSVGDRLQASRHRPRLDHHRLQRTASTTAAFWRADSGVAVNSMRQDDYIHMWAWCEDWFDEKAYTSSRQIDPTGPEAGTRRVHRGGGESIRIGDAKQIVPELLVLIFGSEHRRNVVKAFTKPLP